MSDRLTFRPTPPDLAHIAAIAGRLQRDSGTIFVSRSDVVRTALRIAAATVAAEAAAQAREDASRPA
jgi:Arc/MetJ-type ribon-helix-helix transcriptional regulator